LGDATSRREASQLVVAEVAAFRYSAALWPQQCKDLPGRHSPPAAVQDAVVTYFEQLRTLAEATTAATALGSSVEWAGQLADQLHHAHDDARRRVSESPINDRLWAVYRDASEHRVADLVPALVRASGVQGTSDVETALRQLRKMILDEPCRRDIAFACVHGKLTEGDLDALRLLTGGNDAGAWITSHRHQFRSSGMVAPVHLTEHHGIWTAPRSLRVSASEIRALLGLPSRSDAKRLDSGDELSEPVDPHRPTNLPTKLDPSRLALASRQLHLANVGIELFGDDRGLWCRATHGNLVSEVACVSTFDRDTLCGSEAQFPVILMQHSGRAPQQQPFRLGPLRRLIHAVGRNLDRLYSAHAYVITVGESALRNLLGWGYGDAATRLNQAAMAAGISSGSVLVDTLAGDRTLEQGWVRGLRAMQGGPALGACIDRLADLRPAQIAAELDTLDGLSSQYRPVDGDRFVLLATRTGTSILSASIIEHYLASRFPHATFKRVACDAMVQAEDLADASRQLLPTEPLSQAYSTAFQELAELLHERGDDPLFVISGGTKWESAAMLELALDAQVSLAYKFESAEQPILFRCDQLPTPRVRGRRYPSLGQGRQLAKRSDCRWLVVNVGVSLLALYRTEHGDRALAPTSAQLAAWARAWARKNDWWQLCAELTAFQAWRMHRAADVPDRELNVVLVRTRRRPGEVYAEGQVCGRAIQHLLEDRNVVSEAWRNIDVLNLANVPDVLDSGSLISCVMQPLARCIDEVEVMSGGELPDIVVTGGQKLTSALMHVIARGRGCAVFLVPQPQEGEVPTLWTAHAGGAPDKDLLDPRLLQLPTEENDR
jgi:hypothetical protein